jgi:hypothetical protein
MAGPNWKLRRPSASASLAALLCLAAVSGASAQWLPPIGAASPGEIAQRLQAQGFALIGPLHRNGTIYIADVHAGQEGQERLVIDAWSGEILQRFVSRPRYWRHGGEGYVIERGEFDSPPPLAPPPARDFFTGPGGGYAAPGGGYAAPGGGNFAYGGPPDARIPETVGPVNPPDQRKRVRPKPAARRNPPESKPAITAAPPAQPGAPQDNRANGTAKDNSGGAPPPTAAAPSAPAPNPEASQPPSAPVEQPTASAKPEAAPAEAKPPTPSPDMAQTQQKEPAHPAAAAAQPAAPTPATKPAEKKVNDVPVNTLD